MPAVLAARHVSTQKRTLPLQFWLVVGSLSPRGRPHALLSPLHEKYDMIIYEYHYSMPQTRRHLKVASGLKVGIWQNRTFDVIIRDERHR